MRRPLSLLAAALAAAALVGCSATSDGPTKAATSSGNAATGEVADTVRYAAPGSPSSATADPHGLLPAESDVVRMALLYDALTVPGPDGETKPRLATSWTPDKTLTRWTVKLRDDAVFSDGRPVRARDALFSLRRMQDKAAENFGRMRMFDLAASTTPDDTTLELVTRAPYAEVGTALQGATFVVPEGSTKFTGATVPGSGSYRLVSTDAQAMQFERSDTWWGPKPPTRRIEVRAIPDAQARADALLSNQVDLAGSVPATAAQNLDSNVAQLIRRPGAVTYPLTMRTDTAPFDDVRVRRAVQLALDRRQLLDTVFLGFGEVGNDLITPRDLSSPDVPQRERDVDEARALMAEAGLAKGVDVTLYSTTAYPGMDTAATLIAQQLEPIGIRAKVVLNPPDTFFVEVYGSKPFYLSFLGGIPFLDVVRTSLTPGSPTNETAFDEPTWTADLQAALATPGGDDRRTRLGGLQERLRDEGGYAVWASSDRLDLAAPGLTGVSKGIGFAAAYIDQLALAR